MRREKGKNNIVTSNSKHQLMIMGPKIGEQDEFEGKYTAKFRSLAKPFGELIEYERDRAAIDVGLHLTESTNRKFRTVSNTRVWFQLKGVRESTLPTNDFASSIDVALDLEINDLRFWYGSPEAVYLVVYIECADIFLAEDIRDIIDRQWGERIFHSETFRGKQKKARIRVLTSATFDNDRWHQMLSHRSLRIDGPSFRGRPLGHRLDPLRCVPNLMKSTVFSQVIDRLLSVHRYKKTKQLDTNFLFPIGLGDEVSLSLGVMYHTYEWVPQLTTEFSLDENSDFRNEGSILQVQGPCAVLIHSHKVSHPNTSVLKELSQELVNNRQITKLLVFVNEDSDPGYFGDYFGTLRNTGMQCIPQMLGDIAFNLLIATTVYLEFRDKISWNIVNYLY
jgi:hypothetical protein